MKVLDFFFEILCKKTVCVGVCVCVEKERGGGADLLRERKYIGIAVWGFFFSGIFFLYLADRQISGMGCHFMISPCMIIKMIFWLNFYFCAL